jgi:rare lipoprotein A
VSFPGEGRSTDVRKRAPAAAFWPRLAWRVGVLCCAAALAACGTFSGRSGDRAPDSGRRGGGYYLDDGPGDNPPANLDQVPDAVPRLEPLVRGTARPYSVMGRSYAPMSELAPYRERGMATWYGRRYHGSRTASGEVYDMYRMTGAHPVLPIPSYARVTNLGNGRSVIVRINDRGPFLGDRLIDLSYVAAYKLDLLRNGSALVEVESIIPGTGPAAPGPITVEAPAGPLPAATAEAAPAAALPEPIAAAAPAQASGYYLQLGAFSVRDNAERFAERMRAVLAAPDASLAVSSSGSLHRVQAGPYADRASAMAAAGRIGLSLGSEPLIVGPR